MFWDDFTSLAISKQVFWKMAGIFAITPMPI